MAKKPIKFGGKKRYAAGGSTDRTQARYDRKVADIESDLEKAIRAARGDTRRVNVARAKYEQRMADARNDLAGWRGQDRTATHAAERAAERNLSRTRRTGERTAPIPNRITSAEIGAGRPAPTPISVADITPGPTALRGSRDSMRFGDAFRAAREAGDRTFTWRGREYTTQTRGEVAPRRRTSGGTSTGASQRTGVTSRTTPPRTAPAPSRRTAAADAELARALRGIPDATTAQRNAAADRSVQAMGLRTPTRGQGRPASAPPGAAELRAELERRSRSNGNAKGGKVKKMARGGSVDGIAKRGKTRAKRKK